MQLWSYLQLLLKLMIRKFALTLLPLARTIRFAPVSTTYYRFPVSKPAYLFSKEKGKTDNAEPKAQPKNEDKQTVKNEKTGKKLSELSNEQLIDINTEQSIKIVHLNIKKMEQLRVKQEQQIKELSEKITFMNKSHSQSATKEEQLLENIKMQEEELQRIKKRADKQIQDSKDFAITKLAKQLLEVADCIKRCKSLAEQKIQADNNDEYLKKIIALHQQLKQFFKLYEIEEFDPTNQVFDPNTSEGLVTIPTPPGYQKNNVATTMMTGYKIKSRLLRSAKVGIFI